MNFLPCRICGVAVHGDHEGKGYKVGSYKFAVCAAHVERFETVRSTAVQAAGRMLRGFIAQRFPVVAPAIQALEALSLDEELHE